MKFEQNYVVGIKNIGISNKMTNYAFLSLLEEIACSHSATIGYGVNDVETKKRAWILMDWKLQVIERPIYGEKLTIKTWARPIEKHIYYTYRDFQVFKEEKLVAIASSKWVLMDTNIGKITKITDDMFKLYNSENENVFEEKDISKIKEPENSEFKLIYQVKRSDIDINKHMHNLNYLKLAYEILPEESYYGKEKNSTKIMYKHQIMLDEKVRCYYAKKEDTETIIIKSEDNKVLHAIIELR